MPGRLTYTAHHIKRMFAPYFFRYSNQITIYCPGADGYCNTGLEEKQNILCTAIQFTDYGVNSE